MSDSESGVASEVEHEKRSRTTSNRPNYAIDIEDLDIDENNENEDDDYREEEINEGGNEEDISEEEEQVNRSGRNKRRRIDEEGDSSDDKDATRPGSCLLYTSHF